MRTGASGDSSPLRAFPRRGIRWLLTFACFSSQGHQVTPHLRTLFCSGGWGDSFAPRGPHITLNQWESGVLYTRPPLMWGWFHVNESVPLHMAAADVGLASCEWEVILYTRQPLMWAGIMWMRVSLYTWQPLMWGWNHVNESVPLHMAAADVGLASCEWEVILYTRPPLMWGWFHVNESVPLHMAAADVGLESCESEVILYTRQTTVGGLVSCE